MSGKSYPLGATFVDGGVNFSVYSKNARKVELLLYDHIDDDQPARVVALDDKANLTRRYWHVFVPGIEAGQLYGYRAYGAFDPEVGDRFDPDKVLVDPYGKAVAVPEGYDRNDAISDGRNDRTAMKSVVVNLSEYDWEDDEPLQRAFSHTVIYEMHVGGFTRHPNSGVPEDHRGTFKGVIDKIPYLQQLGVTAVELLPVFQFDKQDAPGDRENYWGYSPISFFAPHWDYASGTHPTAAIDEFRDMVKALHKVGIEVILDVVYNHTCEGDGKGPTQSFKGLDNQVYYILNDDGQYMNYSGCGNTLNANASVVRRMIMDSLRYWVTEMHVDGFRFDLAAILTRDSKGRPMVSPPLLWDIETDPVLSGTKLIAEAWDAAGLYQVGSFFGDHWKEWNGRFRDDVRAFIRGDNDTVKSIAPRFLASPDLYGDDAREPERSINFVTSHDGFTVNDLVSYNHKHNYANGENNRDGHSHTLSWNCGVEGPTDDPAIEQLRNQQVKNLLTITLISLGVPMILMGDEVRRTQQGNNNAYCQDNEISWFDWSLVKKHGDVLRFVAGLIKLRLSLNMYQDNRGRTLQDMLRNATFNWHGVKLGEPDWSETSHTIAFELRGPSGIFMIIFNAYWEQLEFELPRLDGGLTWKRVVDTSLESPHDISSFDDAKTIYQPFYAARARSIVLLSASIAAISPNAYD